MKILVLGGGNDQIAFIEELKSKGAFVILVDYYENPPARFKADFHYRESTLDQEKVLEIARREKVDYVMTACIDQALLTVAYVSEKLGLPAPFTYEQALNVTNKTYMKQVFEDHGIPTARFCVIEDKNSFPGKFNLLNFPMVVKPSDSNGSFGVRKVFNDEQLNKALEDALIISRSSKAVVEEFKEGIEVSADIFIAENKVYPVLMTQSAKLSVAANAFPIYMSLYPASISEKARKSILAIADKIRKAFALNNTPLLLQCIVDNDEVFLIEFGARIGGGSKHHLIKELTGLDFMKLYVNSLFKIVKEIKINLFAGVAAMSYIYAEPGVFMEILNIEELERKKVIESHFLYKTKRMKIESHFASRDRIASFITKADSKEELYKKITLAGSRIKVKDEQGKDIMLHSIFEYANMTNE